MNGVGINSNLQTFANEIMIGTVSSVDVEGRTAKVIFSDREDMVSGDLRLPQSRPFITIERWVENPDEEEKWHYETQYHSADRKIGIGEDYVKGDKVAERTFAGGQYSTYMTSKPDVIKNEIIIKYKKEYTISEPSPMVCDGGHLGGTCSMSTCPITGIIEEKKHRQTMKVYPWIPYIGQLVLCVFLKNGGGDGFIIEGY